jgi:hypothetical protein
MDIAGNNVPVPLVEVIDYTTLPTITTLYKPKRERSVSPCPCRRAKSTALEDRNHIELARMITTWARKNFKTVKGDLMFTPTDTLIEIIKKNKIPFTEDMRY